MLVDMSGASMYVKSFETMELGEGFQKNFRKDYPKGSAVYLKMRADKCLFMGVYTSEEEGRKTLESIEAAYAAGKRTFKMPPWDPDAGVVVVPFR